MVRKRRPALGTRARPTPSKVPPWSEPQQRVRLLPNGGMSVREMSWDDAETWHRVAYLDADGHVVACGRQARLALGKPVPCNWPLGHRGPCQ